MLPLSGIRVVEFCQVLAGPFCGADMGVDVIKVEAPEGDLMRQWPPLIEGYSQYFASVNRNPGRRLDVYRRPPALGEHTAELLAELESPQ